MELREDAARAEEQRDERHTRGEDTGGRCTGMLQHALNSLGAFLTDETLNLSDDLAFRRFLSEHHPGNRDHDQQKGRQGKDGIKRQSGAEALGVIGSPFDIGYAQ